MTGKTGCLYVVATPIGNLDDMTRRAVEVLGAVDVIAAEDTRHSRVLLQHYGIATAMIPLHEHNEERQIPKLMRQLGRGQSIALISDAGTPLISDPGYRLVRAAHEHGIRPVPVPGPSAMTALLSVAGLPVDHFRFEGFPPAKTAARRAALDSLAAETVGLVFYESSHRVMASLEDMCNAFGADRMCCVGRELSKRYESLYRGTLAAVLEALSADSRQQRGEFVILVQGHEATGDRAETEGRRIMDILLGELPVSQAASLAARISGARRRSLYEYGLSRRA